MHFLYKKQFSVDKKKLKKPNKNQKLKKIAQFYFGNANG